MRAQRFERREQGLHNVCFLEDRWEAGHATAEDAHVNFDGTGLCQQSDLPELGISKLTLLC